ncbi:MAG: hypothetical protein CO034_00560 [Parcubacteria group bacterium CG_4_9_14_0_2_um_filter_35_11]|nr:MAG: hypothetical protein COS98_00080 [Parcubacteria group bacterium CG07_land_8_20_14_0_80_35_11]PJC47994.1 MAG: hypothetical protein CO034_00560 [Parcubacteria group bacterium CG_4_9_14_0_2_um_filter_35_11]
MLIDTHAHLNFSAFDKDRNEVIRRCLEENIWTINIGTNYETSKKGVEISNKYKNGVFATVALHPINLETGLIKRKIDEFEGKHFEEEFDFKKYKNLALGKNLDFRSAQIKGLAKPSTRAKLGAGLVPHRNEVSGAGAKKVVAIGEIGLDYYYKPKTKKKLELFKEKQKDLFLKELTLAKELNLPVILHCRMAHQDLIEVLNSNIQYPTSNIRGVMHGFVGNIEQLKKYLQLGFYIGFNGIIFKKIEGINFEENIKKTPLERILLETDCPYLTPPPFESERNEPLYLRYIVQKIAKIKKITSKEITEITIKNTKELFKI